MELNENRQPVIKVNNNNLYWLQVAKSSRRRSSRKTDVDTDESDSDPDQLTSSRTESSNQLDAAKVKQSECPLLQDVTF